MNSRKNTVLHIIKFANFSLICIKISFNQFIFFMTKIKVKNPVVELDGDLLVYKVKYETRAGNNDGKWFFVDYESRADKKIFFVDYESRSDLKIFYVNYESRAGWKNSSKKHLLY